jgi:hypothetical protein
MQEQVAFERRDVFPATRKCETEKSNPRDVHKANEADMLNALILQTPFPARNKPKNAQHKSNRYEGVCPARNFESPLKRPGCQRKKRNVGTITARRSIRNIAGSAVNAGNGQNFVGTPVRSNPAIAGTSNVHPAASIKMTRISGSVSAKAASELFGAFHRDILVARPCLTICENIYMKNLYGFPANTELVSEIPTSSRRCSFR